MLASALLLPGFLGATGYFLDLAYQRSLEAGLTERLQTQIYLLLGAAELEQQRLVMPPALSEPQFSQLNSGLYGLILNADGSEVWRSDSARLLPAQLSLREAAAPAGGRSAFTTLPAASGIAPLFLFVQNTLWEDASGNQHRFLFYLLQDPRVYNAALRTYRAQLWRWLGTLSLVLLMMQLAILRWGLKPLARLAADLHKIETGDAQPLSGDYPREVQQVTDNLNRVLEREQRQRERYRNSLGDLAHSLKTPLAALRGALATLPAERSQSPERIALGDLIEDQVTRMNQIVSHQLQRAIARNLDVKHQQVEVSAVVARLQHALEKVYADKQIQFTQQIAAPCPFHGDERDLMEVLGNLLENAFKYGRTQVALEAQADAAGLRVVISDDGPGVPAAAQQAILLRGARADTVQPGQGIGLAMAVEIISGYGGSLNVDDSTLGGAAFTITLP